MESQENIQRPSGTETEVVVGRPTRRRFTAAYKRGVLKELDGCAHGQVGMVLRREGLYSSQVASWRHQQADALAEKPRGPKPSPDKHLRAELETLRRDYACLEKKHRQAELIIEVQKKISLLLGVESAGGPE